jgi:chromosome segregation ATPase
MGLTNQELLAILGMLGGVVAVMRTGAEVFKRRADSEGLRVETEAKHAQAVLDRLAVLEFQESASAAKINDLGLRASTAEAARERLNLELTQARAGLAESERQRDQLARELDQLKRQLGDTLPPPRG